MSIFNWYPLGVVHSGCKHLASLGITDGRAAPRPKGSNSSPIFTNLSTLALNPDNFEELPVFFHPTSPSKAIENQESSACWASKTPAFSAFDTPGQTNRLAIGLQPNSDGLQPSSDGPNVSALRHRASHPSHGISIHPHTALALALALPHAGGGVSLASVERRRRAGHAQV